MPLLEVRALRVADVLRPGICLLIAVGPLAGPASGEPGDCPVPPPREFEGEGGPQGVLLTWVEPILAEAWHVVGYRIYRTDVPDQPPSAYQLLAELDAAARSFLDAAPPPDPSYMITALTACGEGLPAYTRTPSYPYCPILQPYQDPTHPLGVNPNPRPDCAYPPPMPPGA
jgi:hypothetical protein